jgi:CheY-like chemotaxis protein
MAGGRVDVLLVEDDPIIAFDTSLTLEDLGAGEVERAETLDAAFAVLERGNPSLVVMDIDLRGTVSFALAERLMQQGIPFVFTTGHGAELPIPSELRHAPVLGKPYDPEQLRRILSPYLPHPPLPPDDRPVEGDSPFP